MTVELIVGKEKRWGVGEKDGEIPSEIDIQDVRGGTAAKASADSSKGLEGGGDRAMIGAIV